MSPYLLARYANLGSREEAAFFKRTAKPRVRRRWPRPQQFPPFGTSHAALAKLHHAHEPRIGIPVRIHSGDVLRHHMIIVQNGKNVIDTEAIPFCVSVTIEQFVAHPGQVAAHPIGVELVPWLNDSHEMGDLRRLCAESPVLGKRDLKRTDEMKCARHHVPRRIQLVDMVLQMKIEDPLIFPIAHTLRDLVCHPWNGVHGIKIEQQNTAVELVAQMVRRHNLPLHLFVHHLFGKALHKFPHICEVADARNEIAFHVQIKKRRNVSMHNGVAVETEDLSAQQLRDANECNVRGG